MVTKISFEDPSKKSKGSLHTCKHMKITVSWDMLAKIKREGQNDPLGGHIYQKTFVFQELQQPGSGLNEKSHGGMSREN